MVGRVERVGWGQTRIRGRDTRPTYVPNAHFVQTAVTNMERITHRRFEATVPIRFSDYALMSDVINRIKDRLKTIAKLDVLSMPFRVSFVRVGSYCLEIEITCYFATKSIDEYLALQQVGELDIDVECMDELIDRWMVGWLVEYCLYSLCYDIAYHYSSSIGLCYYHHCHHHDYLHHLHHPLSSLSSSSQSSSSLLIIIIITITM